MLRFHKLSHCHSDPRLKLAAVSTLLVLGLSGCGLLTTRAYYIPAGSMLPTLAINDRVWVDLTAYASTTPQRGDIVVFKPTEALKRDGYNDSFVKRVIGLPGERISFVDGKVYINGKPLNEPYLAAGTKTEAEACGAGAWLAKPQTIPPKHYLMLGDNRNNSYDGRCWGLVPSENIVGQATAIYWPLNHSRSLNGK
jgi:signal peptidase I